VLLCERGVGFGVMVMVNDGGMEFGFSGDDD